MTTMYEKISEPSKLIYGGSYADVRRALLDGSRDLFDDEFGSYNKTPYSADLIIRDYNGTITVDYDIYDMVHRESEEADPEYVGGGKVMDVADLPESEEEFWEKVRKEIEGFISGISGDALIV